MEKLKSEILNSSSYEIMVNTVFGKYTLNMKIIDVEIYKVGEGFSVNALTKIEGVTGEKLKNIPIGECNPAYFNRYAEILDKKYGYAKVIAEGEKRYTIEVYLEPLFVKYSDEFIDYFGYPCFLVQNISGVRVIEENKNKD